VTDPYSASMTVDPISLDRIFDRLLRTLSAGGPDQLRASFTVSEIVQALVPYRTYRNELGVDTVQDYEHALLELLAGTRGYLVCDPDTVTAIRRELTSPDPDTGMLRRLQSVEVRLGAVRMPETLDVRPPIARPDDLPMMVTSPIAAPDAGPTSVASPPAAADAPRAVVSDAIAIGAAMDREDDALRVGSALPSLPELTQLVPPSVPAPSILSMEGVTQANPRTLSRITPLAVPSVYGDPIDFRGVRHAPVDVGGVIFVFGMVARELGFHVESMSSGFPRCEAKRQISPGKWARVRIDFELESRHFRDAGRNPVNCDLIVCWRDTWSDRPASLDVLSLERALASLAGRE